MLWAVCWTIACVVWYTGALEILLLFFFIGHFFFLNITQNHLYHHVVFFAYLLFCQIRFLLIFVLCLVSTVQSHEKCSVSSAVLGLSVFAEMERECRVEFHVC